MKKLTTEEFIDRAKEIWGDRFDYSMVEYKNNDEKVIIICPIHGQFQQKIDNHINSKYGCEECYKNICDIEKVKKEKVKKETNRKELFFKKCFNIHGNKFDYSKTEFISNDKKISIICKEHGEFVQRASAHTSGQGCMECRLELV